MSRYQVMPALSDDEFQALKADIAERGVLVPVMRDQHGHIIDGHHRQQIADELGIDCPVEVRHIADDDEARSAALALNLARRHLTREQKRELIASELARNPEQSDRAVARRLQCSPSTVGSVRRDGVQVGHRPWPQPQRRPPATLEEIFAPYGLASAVGLDLRDDLTFYEHLRVGARIGALARQLPMPKDNGREEVVDFTFDAEIMFVIAALFDPQTDFERAFADECRRLRKDKAPPDDDRRRSINAAMTDAFAYEGLTAVRISADTFYWWFGDWGLYREQHQQRWSDAEAGGAA